MNLATVPLKEWDRIAAFGFDAVWFMGVWERSPAGIHISMQNQGLLARLLHAVHRDVFRNGQWRLCERRGWPDNQSCLNMLAWCWVKEDERYIVVINYGHEASQALVRVPWDELRGKSWDLNDVLSGDSYDRSGDEMRDAGLYIDLRPWQFNLFHVRHSTGPEAA